MFSAPSFEAIWDFCLFHLFTNETGNYVKSPEVLAECRHDPIDGCSQGRSKGVSQCDVTVWSEGPRVLVTGGHGHLEVFLNSLG